jgi:hypothetical protein
MATTNLLTEMKLRAAQKSTGRTHSEESKKVMREKRLQRTIQPWSEKNHSEETKQKIAEGQRLAWEKRRILKNKGVSL